MNKRQRVLNEITLTLDYMIRLTRAYRVADESALRDGLAWYHVAHNQTKALANESGITHEVGAAMVAALSPGCPWKRNISDASLVIEHGNAAACATYKFNVRRAYDIYKTGNIGLLSGVKVVNFYHSIMYPDTHNIPCIDRWIIRLLGIHDRANLRVAERAAAYKAYNIVAGNVKISVPALQAISWIVARGEAW